MVTRCIVHDPWSLKEVEAGSETRDNVDNDGGLRRWVRVDFRESVSDCSMYVGQRMRWTWSNYSIMLRR